MKVSVIGLGKIGSCLSYFLASYGFKVYGYDINSKIVDSLNKLRNPFGIEPQLSNYINKYNSNVVILDNLEKTINNSDISFVIVPTPSNKNGDFSNKYILQYIKKLAPILKRKNKYHLVNITSTVMPGSCDNIFKKYLLTKNLKEDLNFGISYNPHFIALGNVINNLENPDFVLMGSSSKKSYDTLKKIYSRIYPLKKIKKLNLLEAEVTKIAINSYVTMKISFSNIISQIADNANSFNSTEVLNSIGLDKRIGNAYLKVGSAFSGPCFPRDNKAFINYLKKSNINFGLQNSTVKINLEQTSRYIRILNNFKNIYKKNPKVGILGISYKSDSDLFIDSQSCEFVNFLLSEKYSVYYYDEYCNSNLVKKYFKKISHAKNIESLIKLTDIIFVFYKDKKISKKINKMNTKKIIIDIWDQLNLKENHFFLGKNNISHLKKTK